MTEPAWLAKRRKFVVALVTAAGVIASSGLLHGTAELDLNMALALIGAFGVHAVPNKG